MGYEYSHVLSQQRPCYDDTADEYQCAHDAADGGYYDAQAVELLVERCLLAVVYLACGEHLAVLCLVAYGKDFRHGVTFDDLCSPVHVAYGIRRRRVGLAFVGILPRHQFARQCRLVNAELCGLQESCVGRNLFADIQHDYIADDNIAFFYLLGVTVAHYRHGILVVHLVEHLKLLLRLHLGKESHAGGEEYGNDDAGRLEEYLCPVR